METSTRRHETRNGATLTHVDNIKELLDHIEFDGVKFLEQHAKTTFEQLEYEPGENDEVIDPQIDMELRSSPEAVVIRVQFKASTPAGYVLIDGLATFTYDHPIEASRELILEFINKVGFSTYIPYLRQAVHDLTSKCFTHPLILPLFNSEAFDFTPSEKEGE